MSRDKVVCIENLFLISSENDAAVVASKTEGIAQTDLNVHVNRLVGDDVELNPLFWFLVVNSVFFFVSMRMAIRKIVLK